MAVKRRHEQLTRVARPMNRVRRSCTVEVTGREYKRRESLPRCREYSRCAILPDVDTQGHPLTGCTSVGYTPFVRRLF